MLGFWNLLLEFGTSGLLCFWTLGLWDFGTLELLVGTFALLDVWTFLFFSFTLGLFDFGRLDFGSLYFFDFPTF